MSTKKTAAKKDQEDKGPEVYEGNLDDIQQAMADMPAEVEILVIGEDEEGNEKNEVKKMEKASAWRLIRRGRAKLIKK